MGKQKVSDSQLAEALKDEQYKTYYAVAKAVGTGSQTSFIERCHKIEQIYGIPPRISERGGRPKGSKDGEKRQTKPKEPPSRPTVKVEPFVGIAKPKPTISPDDFFNVKLEPVKEKPKEVVSAGPDPERPLKPFPFGSGDELFYLDRLHTFQRIIDGTIYLRENASMRTVTVPMALYNQIPDIFRGTEEKPPILTILEDVALKKKTVNEIANNTDKMEPVFDLEMDDNTDSVKELGPLFEETDYIDEEWGAKPTIREKIKNFVSRIVGR